MREVRVLPKCFSFFFCFFANDLFNFRIENEGLFLYRDRACDIDSRIEFNSYYTIYTNLDVKNISFIQRLVFFLLASTSL